MKGFAAGRRKEWRGNGPGGCEGDREVAMRSEESGDQELRPFQWLAPAF